jgi:hypothetical protein
LVLIKKLLHVHHLPHLQHNEKHNTLTQLY